MLPLVIYHRADFDGAFCREIARKHFGPYGAEYLGWDYADPEPVVDPARPLFILDLSVPSLMQHPRLTWIDHHKSAMHQYRVTIRGYRIDGVAACRLAWQWFNHESSPLHQPALPWSLPAKEDFVERRVSEPIAVRLAGEYDIWDKRDPNAELFQHGLRSRDLALCWPALLDPTLYGSGDSTVAELLSAGKALQYARGRENESLVREKAFTVDFEGCRFLALNTPRCNSLTFLSGLRPEHDGCLAFNWDGKKWTVSLYGVPGKELLDFSVIAVKHGGGGHRQACGFTTASLPFLSLEPKAP